MITANWTTYGSNIQASDGSKLHLVRTVLQATEEVFIVSEEGRNYFPEWQGVWSQTVSFFVAPKNRKAGDVLDEFAKALIPNLDTTSFDSSAGNSDSRALLYYDEVIGTCRTQRQRHYVFTEPGVTDDPSDGEWSDKVDNTENLKRRTWVCVFPDLEAAKAKAEGLEKAYAERARNSG